MEMSQDEHKSDGAEAALLGCPDGRFVRESSPRKSEQADLEKYTFPNRPERPFLRMDYNIK